MKEILWFPSKTFYFYDSVGLILAGIYPSKATSGYLFSNDVFCAVYWDGCAILNCESLWTEVLEYLQESGFFLVLFFVFNLAD